MSQPDCFCETCGAKVVEYRHTLNQALVHALGRLYQLGGQAHINDLGLSFSTINNFQKLRYWFLVDKVQSEEGHTRSGVWRLTDRGWDFVDGVIQVPRRAWTYRGEHVRYDDERELVWFRDEHVIGSERSDDYWANAIPHFLR